MRVTTVSEFGLRRENEYASAADLARALVAQLPDESRDVVADVRVPRLGLGLGLVIHPVRASRNPSANPNPNANPNQVRVREDGRLSLSTQLHMRRQRAAGMLHCAACGGFYAGRRGLRDPNLTTTLSLSLTLRLALSLTLSLTLA